MTQQDYKGLMVIAEQKDGTIHPVAFELLGKARKLVEKDPQEIMALVLGPESLNTKALIERGADKVFHVAGEIFNHPDELICKENIIPLLREIKPAIVLIGATTFGRSLAPRLAAALDTGLTADCTDLQIDEDGKLVQIRPAFTENILAHIKTKTFPQMATIRYREFSRPDPDPEKKGEIIIRESSVKEQNRVEVLEKIAREEINIAEAEVVVAGGRGVKNAGDFARLKELAQVLGGTIGASRDVVDAGFISKAHQVGYSGHRVKPRLYIACGISGAPQHKAGMKESETIIAINTDPSAPIFSIADIGIVGDWYEVIPRLLEIFKEKTD